MQKLIVDTNVVVSSLLQKSYPFLVISDVLRSNFITLCVSGPLMNEYQEVLRREKFSKFIDFAARAETLLIDIDRKATFFTPSVTLNVISDVPDNRLLELAVESEADYLITGNSNDFTFSLYEGTRIVSPKEYWELYK